MLRAAVIMDYQNVHLTARDIFLPGQDPHEALIHPVQFARIALATRNQRQREGFPDAELARVLAYRGLPHVDYETRQHARCSAQADHWRREGAHVELRDLKYRVQHGADGRPVLDIHGNKIPQGPGKEKGIDVLCALACIREATADDIDVVILASRDSDLVPVLDEIHDMHGDDPRRVAKVETVSWFSRTGRQFGHLRPTGSRRIWNTNLGEREFQGAIDRRDYT